MRTTTDVVIVGGGVIGCAIAYFLRKEGRKVLLLERAELGAQASSAAAGLLAPLGPLSGPGPFADLVLAGFARLRALIPELEEHSGLQLAYEQTGALRVVRNPKYVARLQKRLESWKPLGLPLYWLDAEEAHAAEPLLAPDVCAAIYVPDEAQIQASSLVEAYAVAAQRAGAQLLPQSAVTGIISSGTKVLAVRTAEEEIGCGQLILAAGAWTAQCAAWLECALPIVPLHGQMLACSQPAVPLRHLIFGEAAYMLPRGGRVLVGATREEKGFTTEVTAEGIAWLTSTSRRLLPSLVNGTIERAWAGLRPKTPDNHPLIDFLAPWENVIVAAGHNSMGMLLSAVTGQCVAEMVTQGQRPALIQPFSCTRFQGSTHI